MSLEVPKNEHYAVIVTETVYHEGDERSRTCPGHGYPAYTETFPKYIPFKGLLEFETWIKQNKDKEFVAIKAIPLKITTEIVVKVAE